MLEKHRLRPASIIRAHLKIDTTPRSRMFDIETTDLTEFSF